MPIDPGHVRIYNCGPTVYNYVHIGNLSAYILADLLRRVMEYAGYRVTQVMNITDVGHLTQDDVADAQGVDKLEQAARAGGSTPWDLARHYIAAFLRDFETLNIKAAHYYPRATEFIPEMIALIERLLDVGAAYRAGGNVYFDVSKFPAYGKLSGNTVEALEAGARIEVRDDKRTPHDFALWKQDPSHIMQWDAPFGRGFPGWHIECSAMSMRFLGESFDIHTGGEDNIFPHHECEIAQAEAATGKPFVRYWLHKRFLLVDGKKMSKSKGNWFTLADLLAKGFTGREVRYGLLSTHYRGQSNFTLSSLSAARTALGRIDGCVERLQQVAVGEGVPVPFVAAQLERFDLALGDDLNVSKALAALFELVREANKRQVEGAGAAAVLAALRQMDCVLGFVFWPAVPGQGLDPLAVVEQEDQKELWEEARALLAQRDDARHNKDYNRADQVRAKLRELGFEVEDGAQGSSLRGAK